MWDIYFGQWKDGRLKRLAYLGYDVLLIVLGVGVILGMMMLFSGIEAAMSMEMMFANMGFLVVLLMFLFFIALFVANLNIMAKRIRDMGLPAWGTVVGIILVSIILEVLFPNQQAQMSAVVANTPEGVTAALDADASTGSVVSDIFNLIVFLCLLLIPSDTFGNKERSSEQ